MFEKQNLTVWKHYNSQLGCSGNYRWRSSAGICWQWPSIRWCRCRSSGCTAPL